VGRSYNYAEWFVSKKLGLELKPIYDAGYDAVVADGSRYQIKSLCRGGSIRLGVLQIWLRLYRKTARLSKMWEQAN